MMGYQEGTFQETRVLARIEGGQVKMCVLPARRGSEHLEGRTLSLDTKSKMGHQVRTQT